jgi:hypothetical protein
VRQDDRHISDHDLLLAADNELHEARLIEIDAHLGACDSCQARMRQLQQTSTDLAAAYENASETALPDAAHARAALRQRLAEENAKPSAFAWRNPWKDTFAAKRFAYNTIAVLIAVLAIAFVYREFWLANPGGSIAQVQAAPLPRTSLTPGATHIVPSGVCVVPPKEDSSAIPVSERREVFREYGMDYRRASDYELDHLITPALGGSDDIHNLWPEPYASTEWNAHVKDQLEDRLHQMVCSGQIDLATAQRDIATNWIDAYKRYFHTDRPLSSSSPLARYKDEDDDDAFSKS